MTLDNQLDYRLRLAEALDHGEAASATASTKWSGVSDVLASLLGLDSEVVNVKQVGDRPLWNVTGEDLKTQFNRRRRFQLVAYIYRSSDPWELPPKDAAAIRDAVARGAFLAVVTIHRSATGTEVTNLVEVRGSNLADPLLHWFPELQRLVVTPEPTYPGDVPDSKDESVPADSLHTLADQLYLPQEWLIEVYELLRDQKAIVLYGPPGTGKTYIARELSRYLQPRADLRRLVQLHPSFGYEHFFEGYRPTRGPGLSLRKTWGPLRRLCAALEAEPDVPGVLILDEMNRGNLPKVFGELYFLLEYRDSKIELMYADTDGYEPTDAERFGLPAGLHFIGTMNTADRSVALVDQALRRRFAFVPLFVDEPPLAPSSSHPGVLPAFLADSPAASWLPALLEEANMRLGEREASIGPSYFLKLGRPENVTDDAVRRIWKYQVLPTIADRLLGTSRNLGEFEFNVLRAMIKPGQ